MNLFIEMTASSETRHIEILDHDLVRLCYEDEVDVDLMAAKIDYKLYDEITKGKPFRKLVVSGQYTQLSSEAIKYIQAENQKRAHLIIAEAIVVRTLAQRLLGNFYYRLQKPNYNIRLFTSEKKALEWLDNFSRTSIDTKESA